MQYSSVRFLIGTISMLALAGVTYGQVQLPDSLWLPVTYYDYHADHSNPEFEQPMNNAAPANATFGMVQDTLDNDGKPLLQLPVIANARDAYISHWYRSWDDPLKGTKGHKFMPNYHVDAEPTWADAGWACVNPNGICLQYWNCTISYHGDTAVATDTAFKNVVIKDSLLFKLNPATLNYEYDNQEFFPLDKYNPPSSFGKEPSVDLSSQPIVPDSQHNFSFTTEMRTKFSYKKGMTFSFIGDDDLWVFINHRLALDMGGVHSNAVGSFNVDSIATLTGMTQGASYEFALFSAERQTPGSHLKITTNIFVPSGIRIQVISNNDIAGVPTPVLKATVLDSAGNPATNVDTNKITWSIVPTTQLPGDSLINKQGQTLTFLATVANRDVTITSTYVDPTTHIPVTASQTIHVYPGPATHVVVEPYNTGDTANLWHDNPVGHVYVTIAAPTAKAFAVLRDKYGNFVQLGSAVAWTSASTTVALVAPDAAKPYTAVLTSPGVRPVVQDSTTFTAAQGGLVSGSAVVVVQYKIPCQVPVATPPDSNFKGSIQVTLTDATPGATIYYCLDCADPLNDAGHLVYSGPITVSDSNATTIRAAATIVPDDGIHVASGVMTGTYTNLDWTGPHILSVYYYLGSLPSDAVQNKPDTLIVNFNEAVKCSSLTSPAADLTFISHLGLTPLTTASLVSACSGPDDSIKSVTVILQTVKQVTPGKDSLQITAGTIADRWGNPAPAGGPKTVIQWGRDYQWASTTYPIPFAPGKDNVPPEIWSSIIQPGPGVASPSRSALVVAVNSIKQVEIDQSYARIYDALGDIVRDNLPVYASTSEYQFYILWDGTNKNGRLVGSGTYLAVIYIKEVGTSTRESKREKLAIKRE